VRRDTDTEAVVYVRLLDEGTDIRRPARATALPDGTLRLLEPNGYDPIAERWEFPPLAKVGCVTRKFTDGGEDLVAVARGPARQHADFGRGNVARPDRAR
jgi:hypothetical protein